MGTSIDVPLASKDALFVRSHYDTMTVHVADAPEADEVVGPKGKHDLDRVAVRHGHEDGSMTLGGRRLQVRRPRMRTADGERELPVESYEYFADRRTVNRGIPSFRGAPSPTKHQILGSSPASSPRLRK